MSLMRTRVDSVPLSFSELLGVLFFVNIGNIRSSLHLNVEFTLATLTRISNSCTLNPGFLKNISQVSPQNISMMMVLFT